MVRPQLAFVPGWTNYRWNSGDMSPAEKYARAFNKDVTTLKDATSTASGVFAYKSNLACASDNHCASLTDHKCGVRDGETSSYCIPATASLSQGWTTAALLEEGTGRYTAVENGVRFDPNDIKALLTQIYREAHLSTANVGWLFAGSSG